MAIAGRQRSATALSKMKCVFTAIPFEVRIYAEDPQNEFLPASGKLNFCEPEQSKFVRIDSGIRENDADQ